MLYHSTMNEQLLCSIAYNVHDSSVSFAINERVILVLEAERIFKQKKKGCNKEEMEHLIRYGLSYMKKDVDDVAYWAMTTLQNPLLQKEDIFDPETTVPKDPYWKKVEILGKERDVLIVNHHLAHAATYLMSDLKDALIVTCDGGGDYHSSYNSSECVAAYKGEGNHIKRIGGNLDNAINAKVYGACSCFLYNKIWSEGKMMALAAFGTPRQEIIEKLEGVLPQLGTLIYYESTKILKELFPDIKEGDISISDKNIIDFSASAQKLFCDHRVRNISNILKHKDATSNNLVMAGGASLNLDINTAILKNFPKMNHFIASCCDDTGQSLGALCILISEVLHKRPSVDLPYLGMEEGQITYDSDTIDKVVDTLLEDGVAILHNGKAEIGPRALGNRSFIARPDKIAVKKKLSEKIKQREDYRPVAPVTLEEKVHEYFIGPPTSPFMLYKYDVIESMRTKIAGCVHCDGSARVQTVNRKTNPFLYDLIKKFGDKTGIYVLLNTSLNLKGDPIANTIDDTQKIYNQIEGTKILVYNGKIQ